MTKLLDQLQFVNNPFASYSAESEPEIERYFVRPPQCLALPCQACFSSLSGSRTDTWRRCSMTLSELTQFIEGSDWIGRSPALLTWADLTPRWPAPEKK